MFRNFNYNETADSSKETSTENKMFYGNNSSPNFTIVDSGSGMFSVTGTDLNRNTFTETPTETHSPPTFNDVLMIKTIVLGGLFIVSFCGNSATLIQMYRVRKRRSTINTLIVNLAIADLIVTFFCMAGEAIWASTVQWLAGTIMCKFTRYVQGIGLLLSTYITVAISLDRCCVILDPISRNKAPQRVRVMVVVAWILSFIFSIPQALVFTVKRGPFEEAFYQCVDHDVSRYKRMYYLFCLLSQFLLPLGIMIIAYGLIFCTISRKSKEFRDTESTSNSSDQGNRGQVRNTLLRKAKRKALRMSIFIVVTFVICWFPYYVIFTGNAFGYWKSLSPSIMTGFTTVGLTNSMLNPIIYGAFQLCKVHKTRLVWRAVVSKPSSNESMHLLALEKEMENFFRIRAPYVIIRFELENGN